MRSRRKAPNRVIDVSKTGIEEIQLTDTWNHAGAYENVFYTDPFPKVLLKENTGQGQIKNAQNIYPYFQGQSAIA